MFAPDRFVDKGASETVPVQLSIQPYANEVVASVVWVSSPSGLVFTNPANIGSIITVDISGGSPGVDYALVPMVTFVSGHVFQDPHGVQMRVVGLGG